METVIQTPIPIHHVQKVIKNLILLKFFKLFRLNKGIFADGYDENYRGDANDRAWLKTLSEREREAELLKRHEQREIIKRREEINKRLKSKAEESGIKSEEEGEIDDHDDESDHDRKNKNSTRKSNTFDNDIYAEDDDDDYRSSANRRKQINATKQKETEHSKSLQLLVEGRKKKHGRNIFLFIRIPNILFLR